VTHRRRRRAIDRLENGPLRIAIVAESFLPNVNGVTNSVLRIVEHMRGAGHEVIVIAPGPGDDTYEGVPVARVRAIDLPGYDDLRIGLPIVRVGAVLRDFRPDVVHLAAPTVLGAAGVRAAARLGVPSVAVFQTDLAGFAKRNGLGALSESIWSYLRWVHSQADITLAPSTPIVWALKARGVPAVELWARGVDLERFHPGHRSADLRRFLAPHGEVIVGYVGRLAREKQIDRLAPLASMPGVRLVVVGDGPERAVLEARLAGARFLGFRTGAELSQLYASLDVFVHTGIDETFCQALQEAMASGVACVAPSAGGPLDIIRHRENGYFWSPEMPETLAGAVADLVDDAGARHRLGGAARLDVEQRPWARMLDELLLVYRRLATRSTHHPSIERAS
jgi:phosphatidylinositol alpha 1,6-mannosyltransferase